MTQKQWKRRVGIKNVLHSIDGRHSPVESKNSHVDECPTYKDANAAINRVVLDASFAKNLAADMEFSKDCEVHENVCKERYPEWDIVDVHSPANIVMNLKKSISVGGSGKLHQKKIIRTQLFIRIADPTKHILIGKGIALMIYIVQICREECPMRSCDNIYAWIPISPLAFVDIRQKHIVRPSACSKEE